jgi:hypothetical protein
MFLQPPSPKAASASSSSSSSSQGQPFTGDDRACKPTLERLGADMKATPLGPVGMWQVSAGRTERLLGTAATSRPRLRSSNHCMHCMNTAAWALTWLCCCHKRVACTADLKLSEMRLQNIISDVTMCHSVICDAAATPFQAKRPHLPDRWAPALYHAPQ